MSKSSWKGKQPGTVRGVNIPFRMGLNGLE